MAKRKLDAGAEPRTKKPRNTRGRTDSRHVSEHNNFDALPASERDLDSDDATFDYAKPQGSVVLVESDDDVVVESDSEEAAAAAAAAAAAVAPAYNELAKNQDFILFGFESSDDHASDAEGLDDGVLSNDEGGVYRAALPKSLYPWIKDHDHSKQKEIADWLTMEMKDFVNYILPSRREIETRNHVVMQLKQQVAQFWPGTEVHVFGLYATDLYLPGSDIDMVVVSLAGDLEHRSRLYQLSSFLRNRKLAKNIEVIAKAKVPIIKFVDPRSDIHIDVSFERTNGIIAAKKIRRWLASTPGLRELVLIVKQFLRSRKLNNVHVGGLGGYLTIIMCYHFLRMHPRVATHSISILDNLGALLIEFFELYGRNFLYDDLILAIDDETDVPKYLRKRLHPLLNTARNAFAITIQDPSDQTNNITRSSYNLRDLKKAFGGAYQLLVDKCYELHAASYKGRVGQLILGDIIKYQGEERDFNDDRDKVTNHALVKHGDDAASEDELDGTNGNDKYYYSDMTVESEEDTTFATEGTEVTTGTKRAAELMSVLDEENEAEDVLKNDEVVLTANGDERPAVLPKKPKSNLDKDTKRDYWRQKGLEL